MKIVIIAGSLYFASEEAYGSAMPKRVGMTT